MSKSTELAIPTQTALAELRQQYTQIMLPRPACVKLLDIRCDGQIKIGSLDEKLTETKGGRPHRVGRQFNGFGLFHNRRLDEPAPRLVPDEEANEKIGFHFLTAAERKKLGDKRIIGEGPRQLHVRLLWDRLDCVWPNQHLFYWGNRTVCTGDRVVARTIMVDKDTGELTKVERPCCPNPEDCPWPKEYSGRTDAKCKWRSRLWCRLDEDGLRDNRFWIFPTGSFYSNTNTYNTLVKTAWLSGFLADLPFVLHFYRDPNVGPEGDVPIVDLRRITDDEEEWKQITLEVLQQRIAEGRTPEALERYAREAKAADERLDEEESGESEQAEYHTDETDEEREQRREGDLDAMSRAANGEPPAHSNDDVPPVRQAQGRPDEKRARARKRTSKRKGKSGRRKGSGALTGD